MKNETSKTDELRPLNKHGVGRSAVHCFECSEYKDLIKDWHHKDIFWCKVHYPERHKIISDFIRHAIYGT